MENNKKKIKGTILLLKKYSNRLENEKSLSEFIIDNQFLREVSGVKSSGIYVGLDIGTSSVKVIVGEMIDKSLNIIGVGTSETYGIRKGVVVDIDEVVQSIQEAVTEAENMVGIKINQVLLGIPSHQVQIHPCNGIVTVANEDREITDHEIDRVIDAAQSVIIPPDQEMISLLPHDFILDGYKVTDPRGMIGVRLELEASLITGPMTLIYNLIRCVEKAGLQINDVCLQSVASGSVALSKDEKDLGVALVDLGAGTTTVSVFEHGILQHSVLLSIGGENISKDLSIVLRTSLEDAEKVKLEYGYAHPEYVSDEETFTIPIIGSDEYGEFSHQFVAEIIEPRVEEILLMVKETLVELGYEDLAGGIVLTGGASSLPGILEVAKRLIHSNVRIAIPDYIGVRDPKFTTSVGIIQFMDEQYEILGVELSEFPLEEMEVKRQEYAEEPAPKNTKVKLPKPPKKEGETISNKVKRIIGMLFD